MIVITEEITNKDYGDKKASSQFEEAFYEEGLAKRCHIEIIRLHQQMKDVLCHSTATPVLNRYLRFASHHQKWYNGL